MLYKIDIPLPPNTPIKSPIKFTMPLSNATIKNITVFFPWGCAGLVGIQVIRNTWQLAPLTRGEWLTGNNYKHVVDYDFPINVEPYEIIIKGYNADDTYNHKPFVTIEMSTNALGNKLRQLLNSL